MDECAEEIKDAYKEAYSMEVDVTAVRPRPIDGMPHEVKETDCRHGSTYYVLPTLEQVVQWVFRGIQ